jgi:6-phosphogluconolactonase
MAGNLISDLPPPPAIIIVPTEEYAQVAAGHIAQAVQSVARRQDRISLGLSGGRGPRPVYQELARAAKIPWQRLDLYFADERAVPPESSLSNYRLVSETLGPRFSDRPMAIHRMEADRTDLATAAAEYEAILPVTLDLLILGMGDDGHTASLYPHHPALAEEHRRVLAVQGPADPPWRMTVTPPVIRSARAVVMLVAGAPKAAAVARAHGGVYDPVSCPAQLAREGVWILDHPAAAQLPSVVRNAPDSNP